MVIYLLLFVGSDDKGALCVELLPGLHWLLVCVGIVVPAFEGKACQQVFGLLWQVFPIVLLAQWLCVGACENVDRKNFAC